MFPWQELMILPLRILDRLLIVAPTGTGKTIMYMSAATDYLRRHPKCRVVIVCKDAALANSQHDEFCNLVTSVGFRDRPSVALQTEEAKKRTDPLTRIMFVTYNTAGQKKFLKDHLANSLIIMDEVHFLADPTDLHRSHHHWVDKFREGLKTRRYTGNEKLLGLTASLNYSNRSHLEKTLTPFHVLGLEEGALTNLEDTSAATGAPRTDTQFKCRVPRTPFIQEKPLKAILDGLNICVYPSTGVEPEFPTLSDEIKKKFESTAQFQYQIKKKEKKQEETAKAATTEEKEKTGDKEKKNANGNGKNKEKKKEKKKDEKKDEAKGQKKKEKDELLLPEYVPYMPTFYHRLTADWAKALVKHIQSLSESQHNNIIIFVSKTDSYVTTLVNDLSHLLKENKYWYTETLLKSEKPKIIHRDSIKHYNCKQLKNKGRIIVANTAYATGFEFKKITELHTLPPMTSELLVQTRGRVRRYCSHGGLEHSEWNVKHFVWMPKNSKDPVFDTMLQCLAVNEAYVRAIQTQIAAKVEAVLMKISLTKELVAHVAQPEAIDDYWKTLWKEAVDKGTALAKKQTELLRASFLPDVKTFAKGLLGFRGSRAQNVLADKTKSKSKTQTYMRLRNRRVLIKY